MGNGRVTQRIVGIQSWALGYRATALSSRGVFQTQQEGVSTEMRARIGLVCDVVPEKQASTS